MATDHQAIIDITLRYAWALDTHSFDELHQVFAPDVTADMRGVAVNGVDEMIARISNAVNRFDVTQHITTNHQIVVDGDTATCRCQLQSQHVTHSDDGNDDLFTIGGHYYDSLVRTADGWRITHRVMTQTWMSGNPRRPS
jgi:3-phenylpropionate/cinnamic acid dioxygenase small subunit